jgi:hypothetical protein
MRDRKERGRYSASRRSGSIRGDGRLGTQKDLPTLYHMVQHGHLDVPIVTTLTLMLPWLRQTMDLGPLKEQALQN